MQLIHERDRLNARIQLLEAEAFSRASAERDFQVESSRRIRELETNLALSTAAEEDVRKQIIATKVSVE
jgi:hypothetical protein